MPCALPQATLPVNFMLRIISFASLPASAALLLVSHRHQSPAVDCTTAGNLNMQQGYSQYQGQDPIPVGTVRNWLLSSAQQCPAGWLCSSTLGNCC